ncbi:daunorubicin C-13 ketoreductase [Dactylonectria estremocensis]|uniref:Daunorubicin C-13 ketoreductase n=1 Tax=Dactylonectria estremocensis TaxID=1079267 RepID=A0A9P9FDI2_9HYPO|nr:daunorubicin C-13 ketoreductase [Dactylonectria estremocensis]
MTKAWNPRLNMPDLKGKVAVVTGGNSGIGLHTVKHLASKGAKVYFTARSEAKATYTIDYVLSNSAGVSKDRVIWLSMDLSDVKSVKYAVEELRAKEQTIHILVNNAGLVMNKFETTEAGWEMAMAVCHVGHFVFTNGILPLLKRAASNEHADVRIVTVSSSVQYFFFPPKYEFDFTTPAFLTGTLPYDPWQWRYLQKHMFTADMMRYSLAKLANFIFAQELQRRLDEQGSSIISLSVHPGSVRSPNALDIFSAPLKALMRRVMLGEDEGSFTLLFAATAKDVRERPDEFKGKYVEPVGEVKPGHVVGNDEKQVQGLWDTTTNEVNKLLAKKGYAPLLDW